MERFKRLEQLLGKKELRKLEKASIAVFGLGAVGSFAVEALARSGVGEFALIDFDEVRHSNFNRQLYALESNLGKLKVELARERILEINPGCKVSAFPDFAASDNFEQLLKSRPDLVVDAIDSVNPKTELIAYCLKAGIPVVSSMGAGAKTNPFLIKTGDISESSICPLARRLRKRLRRKGITGGIRCVYSTEEPLKKRAAIREEEFHPRGRQRQPVGTISYLTGMFGLMAAFEAMKILLGGFRDDQALREAGKR